MFDVLNCPISTDGKQKYFAFYVKSEPFGTVVVNP